MACLGGLLQPSAADWDRRSTSLRLRQAEENAAAKCLEIFFFIVTVLWSATNHNSSSGKPSKQPSRADWQARWIKRAATSNSKSEALTNLLKAVQPLAPQPLIHMAQNGSIASASVSQAGWRKRLFDEKQREVAIPPGVMQSVDLQLNNIMRKAGRDCLGESFDLSFGDVCNELGSWGASASMPSDWLPRAALRSSRPEVKLLVWCVLCRAWRLMVRPQPWGIGR